MMLCQKRFFPKESCFLWSPPKKKKKPPQKALRLLSRPHQAPLGKVNTKSSSAVVEPTLWRVQIIRTVDFFVLVVLLPLSDARLVSAGARGRGTGTYVTSLVVANGKV